MGRRPVRQAGARRPGPGRGGRGVAVGRRTGSCVPPVPGRRPAVLRGGPCPAQVAADGLRARCRAGPLAVHLVRPRPPGTSAPLAPAAVQPLAYRGPGGLYRLPRLRLRHRRGAGKGPAKPGVHPVRTRPCRAARGAGRTRRGPVRSFPALLDAEGVLSQGPRHGPVTPGRAMRVCPARRSGPGTSPAQSPAGSAPGPLAVLLERAHRRARARGGRPGGGEAARDGLS
jgi:hypothetical protein